MSVNEKIKEIIGKIALNESRPTKEKTKNARKQANQAKAVLRKSLERKSEFHKKTAIRKN